MNRTTISHGRSWVIEAHLARKAELLAGFDRSELDTLAALLAKLDTDWS